MSANKILALQQRQSELENGLLNMVKSTSFTHEDIKKMNDMRTELDNVQREREQVEFQRKNWNCSHHFKCVNGKVEEVYEINHKPVSKTEYLSFVKQNMDQNKFVPVLDKDGLDLWLKPLIMF